MPNEPFDLAGDALGHSRGNLRKSLGVAAPPSGSVCGDHRSNRVAGSSLVQGISGATPQFGGRAAGVAADSALKSVRPADADIKIRAEVAAHRRPTNGSKGNATTEVLDQAIDPAPSAGLPRQDDPDRLRSGPRLGRVGRAQAADRAGRAAQAQAPLRAGPLLQRHLLRRARALRGRRQRRVSLLEDGTNPAATGATGASGPSGATGAAGSTPDARASSTVHVVQAEPQAAAKPTAAATRVTAKAAGAVVSRPLSSPTATAKK